jgi:hypothetical protein
MKIENQSASRCDRQSWRSILMAFVKSAQGCGQAFTNCYSAALTWLMIARTAQNRSRPVQWTYDDVVGCTHFPTRTQLDETKISRHYRARLLQAISGRPSATGSLPGGLGKSSIRKDSEMVRSLVPYHAAAAGLQPARVQGSCLGWSLLFRAIVKSVCRGSSRNSQ